MAPAEKARIPGFSPVPSDSGPRGCRLVPFLTRPRRSRTIEAPCREQRMDKPRIFLGSSGLQKKLLDALTRGLEDVAHLEPWTTSFNPGTSTLARLFGLAHEVDFAVFVFARDDWTAAGLPASPPAGSGQASPRDNVVFEAGLFGGALGMHRTFILCEGLEASERSPRVYMRAVRRSGDPFRDESHQPEASEGDRERGPRRTHRGPVVAVLPDGARSARAFRREPHPHLAGPRRRARATRPRLARGRQPVGAILERSGEGEEGTFGRLSIIGRENGLGTRTRRSWTGREKSCWSPSIAGPGTSSLVRTRA